MKRIPVVVLALLAAALFLSFSALAWGSGEDASAEQGAVALVITADGQESYSKNLSSALNAAGNGGYVVLLDNFTVTNLQGIAVSCSVTLDLNGNTVSAGSKNVKTLFYANADIRFTVTDSSEEQTGAIVCSGSVLSAMHRDAEIYILGGSFEGGLSSSRGEIVVRGGRFDSDVSGFVPDGMTQDDNGAVVLDAEEAVASVDGVGYVSLRDAVIAASPGGTVTMLQDVECETWEQVWNLQNVVFDGGGHTLTIRRITSGENHDAVFHSSGGNKFSELNIDLSSLESPSSAQGSRAFNATNGDIFYKVNITGCEFLAFGIFAGGVEGDTRPVTITECAFTGCAYGVGSEPASGTVSSLGRLEIFGCSFSGCGYAVILYPAEAVFSGNTVSGGRLNVMHVGQTVAANSFEGGSRVKFYEEPEQFRLNSISADSRLDADGGAPVIDISENYWGGGAPSAEQLGGVRTRGGDVYYTSAAMGEGDLNTSCTITVRYGNGAPELVFNCQRGYAYPLPDAPSRSGYAFLGWSSAQGDYAPGETAVITGDTVFSAVWVRHPDMAYVPPEEPDEAAEPLAPAFGDVPSGAWYFDAVRYVCAAGIMDGVADGVFAPDAALTRAMVWTMLARMSGADVSGGASWYSAARDWAMAAGVSDGEDAAANVTREQFVTMLWRLRGSPAAGAGLSAPDAGEVSGWAAEAMSWAGLTGLIEGDETGAVSPTAQATRAAAAALIQRCASLGA